MLPLTGALLGSVLAHAGTQSLTQGRMIFEQKGCQQCHAYASKRGASAVRDMMRLYGGDPEKAFQAFSGPREHASLALPQMELQQISAWLANMPWPEDEPDPSVAAKARQEEAKARREAEQKAQAEDLARQEKEAKSRQEAELKAKQEVQAKEIQARADKDAAEKARAKKAGETKARQEAQARAKEAAAAQTRAKKEAEAKARQESAVRAKQEPEAKPRKEAEAKPRPEEQIKAKEESLAKKEAEAKARKEAEFKAKNEAETKAKAKAEAQARAKQEAEAKVRKETEAKARAEAEAKAKAEAQVKRETEARAKQEAEAKARKEAESVAKAEPAAKKDRGKMKAPEKFRDEPCPPNATPVGKVDEARAKEIMERIGCTQCHAYAAKKTGPSLKKVWEKVKDNPDCVVKRLKENKEHRDEGVTQEIQPAEFKVLADYYATRAK